MAQVALVWDKLEASADPNHGVPCSRSSHGLSVVQNGIRLVLVGEHIARTPIDSSAACWALDLADEKACWRLIDSSKRNNPYPDGIDVNVRVEKLRASTGGGFDDFFGNSSAASAAAPAADAESTWDVDDNNNNNEKPVDLDAAKEGLQDSGSDELMFAAHAVNFDMRLAHPFAKALLTEPQHADVSRFFYSWLSLFYSHWFLILSIAFYCFLL
jgi:hypothetical protein